ncbi:Integral membrane protein [Salmonella enterica subsp. enterica]|uniref:Integral membrane protein n=1 Tax=Salmonella enterica I TaxID=59201 RepID=A0A379WIK1_SALET|nr:Integral membrane protein [Salmonella enterica subsp. enterica]
MTLSVFCILLFAALLHASWNAIVKAGNDKLYAAIGVSGSAAVMALILLPLLAAASSRQYPFFSGLYRAPGGVYRPGGEKPIRSRT